MDVSFSPNQPNDQVASFTTIIHIGGIYNGEIFSAMVGIEMNNWYARQEMNGPSIAIILAIAREQTLLAIVHYPCVLVRRELTKIGF